MYCKLIKNDILKSKVLTLTTMLFVAAAALLVSLVAILIVNLSGSIDTLMTQAKTPHFLQMHAGEIDGEQLSTFAQANDNVEDFQMLEFLNVDGSKIIIGENSLVGSVQDNGFSTQSKKFDYLLDLNGEIIEPLEGEIYVPIGYMKDGTAKVGDHVVVGDRGLTVAGFLRDSQMNSLLASSKRFLVSEKDYKAIVGFGSPEYLIEFRLKDLGKLSQFENDYTSAKLEANGPTITYPLFKLLSAISDGLMIAVILLISILVVAIALLCIRFTLLAKIEEDYREIGVMKAIGLRVSDIKKIYLAKYAALGVVGCLLGFVLSLFLRGMLLENIRLNMGESEKGYLAPMFGMIGVMLVALVIIAYVSSTLRRFKKISAAEAIRFGMAQEKSRGAKHFCLSGNRLMNTQVFLGIKDVLTRKKLYGTMLGVMILSVFIMIVPQNVYHTISSKSFITFMGTGSCDMRIDIQQTTDISEKATAIAKAMATDSGIAKYVVLTTKTFNTKLEDGTEESIKIEFGDHSVFPLDYASGRAPMTEDEIVLSVMNAQELGKKVGDQMTLIVDGKEKQLQVCGIYSDITNGGKTAKAIFSNESTDIMWSIICGEFSDKAMSQGKVQDYSKRFDFAKVSGVDDYITQTFGSTINAVGKASSMAMVVALIISGLITLLFMKMLVAKDRYSIAVMKSFGFTTRDMIVQYISRVGFVLVVGVVVGTFLANTLGEAVVGGVIGSFGAASFKFVVSPISVYVLCPMLMFGVVLIATLWGTSGIDKIQIAESIKE